MKPKIKEILCGAFAVITIPVGLAIHGWLSLMFLLSASILVSFTGYFSLLNHRVHGIDQARARNWAFLLFVVLAIGGAEYWHETEPPKLHFTLNATLSGSPDERLNFTNKFLFVETSKTGFKFPTNIPFLKVDVAKDEPQFTLHFGIFNDSAPRFSGAKYDIKKPQLSVWIPDPDPGQTLKWKADPKWKEASSVKDKFPGHILVYDFPDSLSAGTGDSAPGITINMEEKPSGMSVAIMAAGENVSPFVSCFKLLAIPSIETVSKMQFNTNSVVWWNWIYRPVAYRPIETPIVVTPSRVHLSDGTNLWGKEITISNPSSSNVYAMTLSIEIENGAVPINSLDIEVSNPKEREKTEHGDLEIPFEAGFDVLGYTQSRLFVIPVLQAQEKRTFWVRGSVLTNSFAVVSIWQSLNSFPDIAYRTNGMWMWPVLSSNSAWWIHIAGQPMDLDFGIAAWVGTNGFTNDSQIIRSRP